MQPIEPAALDAALCAWEDQLAYLHLETTAGAYTAGGFGAFIRNARVRPDRIQVRGSGPFRLGLAIEGGFVYAEGVTHWETDAQGRLLTAGYDGDGRLSVVCELSRSPFPVAGTAERRSPVVAALPQVAPPTAERAVLAVLAHPDDETFGCAGTLALYAGAGIAVTCACATRGELGRNTGVPSAATRESLPLRRVSELEAACGALGIGDLRLLGVWDKTVEFADPEALSAQIAAILREVGPSLLITHHAEWGGHPDHCAVGAAALRAVDGLAPDRRPRLHVLVPPRAAQGHDIALQTVDVTPVLEAKLAAVRAHWTQSAAMLRKLAPEELATRFGRERYLPLSDV